jgi:PTS system cellobiose-specific IIC component
MLLMQKSKLWLEAIQHGFVFTLPVVMLGAFALTILQIPHYFSVSPVNDYLLQVSQWVWQASYGIMALTLVMAVSFRLTTIYQNQFKLVINPLIVALLAMVTLVAVIQIDFSENSHTQFGVLSVFKALICAVVFTELFLFLYQRRLINFTYLRNEVDDTMHLSMRAMLPAIVAPFLIVMVYGYFLKDLDLLKPVLPFLIGAVSEENGLGYFQGLILIVVNQLMWFVGIHGSSLIEVSSDAIFMKGESVPFTKQFFDVYVHMGGAGCTLGLILALLFSKKSGNRQLAKYALLPGIFNINELLIFGLPIVLNRYLFIPFILAPILTMSLARIAMETGLINMAGMNTAWSTPVLLSGYLSGGNLSGALVQVLGVIVSALLYHPFIRRYDQVLEGRERKKVSAMMTAMIHPEFDMKLALNQRSSLGQFCRRLNKDMLSQLNDDYFEIHYQPKMSGNKKVSSVEALARWHHPVFGNISPGLFVNLAEASGAINKLGDWVLDRCLRDIAHIKESDLPLLRVAINVSPKQLSNPDFFKEMIATVARYSVPEYLIELEITEGQRLMLSDELLAGIDSLSKAGFSIALDDFGMGYMSLRYLKSFHVDTIKLDGSIITDVTTSSAVQDIIRSMGGLARAMGVNLVAEWVEDRAQFELLRELGCDQYQGAYFSMALNLKDLIKFCKKNKIEAFDHKLK